MTPDELTLLSSINDKLGILINKFSAETLEEPKVETEETEKPNSELLLEGE